MATIIAVHGTFATGEETGDKWWQKNSECEKALREFVQGNATPLSYESLIWDGDNSETSRRAAAGRLLHRMSKLEAAGEPYVVIGHSHGGSVVAFALQRAARDANTLPHLRAWITIGTPFIVPEKRARLFSRLDTMGKGVLVVAGMLVAAIAVHMFRLYGGMTGDVIEVMALGALLAFGATKLLQKLPEWMEGTAPDWQLLEDHYMTAVDGAFRSRWLQLWHPDDEAIFALRAAASNKPRIFPDAFAAAPLLKLFVYALPFIVLAIAACTPVTTRLAAGLTDAASAGSSSVTSWFAEPAPPGNILDRSAMVVLALPVLISRLMVQIIGVPHPILLGGALLGITVAGLMLANWLATKLSYPLSRKLNQVTLDQLRALFYGADVASESMTRCDLRPFWSTAGMGCLPPVLSQEISAISDDAAAKAVGTLRARANEIVSSSDFKQRLAEYLTWDELIHTTYFKSPLFLRLLAYAISTAEGFAATPALLRDARYVVLREWLDEIRRSARVDVSATGGVPLASAQVS